MSEWLDYVKAYAEKNTITYKQALKDASPSYKTNIFDNISNCFSTKLKKNI